MLQQIIKVWILLPSRWSQYLLIQWLKKMMSLKSMFKASKTQEKVHSLVVFRAESALWSPGLLLPVWLCVKILLLNMIFFSLLKRAQFLSSAPSEPSGKRPPIVADSEVYKMLQENQESDEPPRQSASFKVLQEILETGTDTMFFPFTLRGNVGFLYFIFKQCLLFGRLLSFSSNQDFQSILGVCRRLG